MTNTPNSNDYCKNCHYPMDRTQQYCGQCGQKKTTGHVTLWEFLGEFVSTILNLENQTFSTLRELLKPGRLTRAYFRGQHKRYGHPIRVFLIAIVALVALISFQIGELDDIQIDSSQEKYYGGRVLALIDSSALKTQMDSTFSGYQAFRDTLELQINKNFQAQRNDSTTLDQVSIGIEISPTVLTADLYELSMEELEKKYMAEEPLINRIIFKQKVKFTKHAGNFITYMVGRASWVLILLLPLLAVVLKLLYIRRKIYYIEHLVFSLHVHSFIFICLFVATFVNIFWGQTAELVWFILIFLIPLYLYLAMRYFYGQGWFKTWVKFSIAGFMYLILISFCSVITLLLGFVLF